MDENQCVRVRRLTVVEQTRNLDQTADCSQGARHHSVTCRSCSVSRSHTTTQTVKEPDVVACLYSKEYPGRPAAHQTTTGRDEGPLGRRGIMAGRVAA